LKIIITYGKLKKHLESAKSTKQNKEFMFWQKTNHPTELSTPEIFDQKVEYIHNNPVEAGIGSAGELYL
jgi:putative transposase